MKITPKPTPTTFTDLIDGMEVDQEKLFKFGCSSGVRSAIYRIKQRSEKDFETKKKPDAQYGYLIEVTRIK